MLDIATTKSMCDKLVGDQKECESEQGTNIANRYVGKKGGVGITRREIVKKMTPSPERKISYPAGTGQTVSSQVQCLAVGGQVNTLPRPFESSLDMQMHTRLMLKQQQQQQSPIPRFHLPQSPLFFDRLSGQMMQHNVLIDNQVPDNPMPVQRDCTPQTNH